MTVLPRMSRRVTGWILVSVLALAVTAAAWGNLLGFVMRGENEFRWTREGESDTGPVKTINLKVQSQKWRTGPWEHNVRVFLPREPRFPRTAFLFITGGNPNPAETLLFGSLAQRIGAPLAILYNIPNQPLYDGKVEDDLIAHTFQEYLNSGDASWPLLLPMVKSAVRTMDALQELSRKEWPVAIEDFVVSGASKRGWTTYLTAASDRRVRAIAPMVFDNLRFEAQMPRQLQLWGTYSEQIADYTRRGLIQKLDTPRGRELVGMVDPWFYRKQLTMPKLLIHGANDRYWATDAVRAYWNDLEGKKYLLQVPNSGHGLEDRGRVLNTLAAFFQAVAADRPFPEFDAAQAVGAGIVSITARSTIAPAVARLWVAHSDDLDFRRSRWEPAPMEAAGEGRFTAQVPLPEKGGLSVYAEAEYRADGQTFTLTSPPYVYGERPAAAAR